MLATYAVAALIIMFLLNIFVLPWLMGRSVVETTYSDFLNSLDAHQVKEVQIDRQDYVIFYTIEDGGKTKVCKTGLLNIDNELVEQIRSPARSSSARYLRNSPRS